MVWQKAWLDTRWRFFTGLVLLLILACGTIVDYHAVRALVPRTSLTFDVSTTMGRALQDAFETQRDYRGFVWWNWFRQNLAQLWTLFAILIGAGGLLARSTGDGALFALTLPASRRQLLGGRVNSAPSPVERASSPPAPIRIAKSVHSCARFWRNQFHQTNPR